MRIHMAEAWKKCPKYGKIEYQVKAGRNSSGANAASVRNQKKQAQWKRRWRFVALFCVFSEFFGQRSLYYGLS